MADAIHVILDRPVGVDHRRTVRTVQTTVPEPFLAAAREDPRRTTDPVQLALLIAPLDHSVDADAWLVTTLCHDSPLPACGGLNSARKR
jgi:hypothetical protein